MQHLTRNDYACALRLLARLEAEVGDAPGFAHALLGEVSSFVAAESAELATGHGPQAATVPAAAGLPKANGHGDASTFRATVGLWTDGHTTAQLVLYRRGQAFSERDHERLELLRPHLAFLYRQAVQAGRGLPSALAGACVKVQQPAPTPDLTRREGDVMHWLACGKTDADIAALLAISPRTVSKHLEHIYVKLGVETRTAAVMRAREKPPAAEQSAQA